MAFDLDEHFGTMSRRVSNGERDGQETIIVHAARTYPTDAHDLWEALTTRDRLSRWFMPVSGDLRLGGRYQFEGNAGGTIEECEPPEHVRATWEYGGQASWVTLRLEADGAGTRLTLEHEAHVDPDFVGRFGPGAVGVGWDLGFLGLSKHLEDPAATRPEAGGWETSPEAMGFYRRASEAWGQAAIEGGTPTEQATAAAENTRAFYSGEGPGADGSGAEEATTS